MNDKILRNSRDNSYSGRKNSSFVEKKLDGRDSIRISAAQDKRTRIAARNKTLVISGGING